MHKLFAIVLGSSLLLAACGSSSIQTPDTLAGKKAKLDSLKDQQEKLGKQIADLQAQIDSSGGTKEKAKLVALSTLAPGAFSHYIDLQGSVDAINYSNIAPRGNGGVVREVYVKQGDHVGKGQLLLKLDDALQKQQLTDAQIKLAHAKDIYQRRKNLWDEKIGQEIDLVNAKNDVDQAEVQVKMNEDQLDWTNVYTDIPGTVNTLNVKVGQAFTAATTGQLQVINTDNLKVTVQVPDVYQERVRVGTPVRIVLPGLNNKEITGTVYTTSPEINANNRSFLVEIHLPHSSDVRANQVALVRLQDYTANNAIVIPVNTLQTDEKGKYVMVAARDQDKTVAKKRTVTIGQTYGDKVEITGGLQSGDQLITDGFQGLYDGQLITTQP